MQDLGRASVASSKLRDLCELAAGDKLKSVLQSKEEVKRWRCVCMCVCVCLDRCSGICCGLRRRLCGSQSDHANCDLPIFHTLQV